MRHLMLGLCLLFGGCRYLVPTTPSVSPERPQLLSGGNPTDPGRQPNEFPGRRCVVACGAGFHCDEERAECAADVVPARRDGGVSWLP